jgi:hypothetical protein
MKNIIYMCVCVCVCVCHNNNHTQCYIYNNMCYKLCLLNIPRLEFMERSLAQVKCTMYIPESLIQFCLCNVKKVFNMGFMVPRTPSQF